GPQRPLLQSGDLPKAPQRVPRYIPEHELARLMQAIRALSCPYQRAALLIARWSGPGATKSCGCPSTAWTATQMGRHAFVSLPEKPIKSAWCRSTEKRLRPYACCRNNARGNGACAIRRRG